MARVNGFILVMMLVAPQVVFSEPVSVSSKARSSLFKSQLSVLDNRSSKQYSNSINLKPPHVVVPGSGASGPVGPYDGVYADVARSMAVRHGVPTDLFLRLVQQESGGNAKARSHKGAIGLAQLMPGTAKVLRVDPHDPNQNLEGGARYLRQMYEKFGTWRLALAAYNAGPEAVQKYSGVPPYNETQKYVKRILGS